MLCCSKSYPKAVVLIALQDHELFMLFGKGIDVSKNTYTAPRSCKSSIVLKYWVIQNVNKRLTY